MIAVIYRFLKLAWRYRRLVALALTLVVGLLERHRSKLPKRFQNADFSKIPGVKASGPVVVDADPAPPQG